MPGGVRPGVVSVEGMPVVHSHEFVSSSTASLFPLRKFKFVKICVDSMKSFAREQVRLGKGGGAGGRFTQTRKGNQRRARGVRRLGGRRAQL